MNEDNKAKVEAFLADYKALTDKHQMDFASFPVYMPDGQGGFRTVLQSQPVDTSKMSKPSPFMGADDVAKS